MKSNEVSVYTVDNLATIGLQATCFGCKQKMARNDPALIVETKGTIDAWHKRCVVEILTGALAAPDDWEGPARPEYSELDDEALRESPW